MQSLSFLISQIKSKIKRCDNCFYVFHNASENSLNEKKCRFCRDKNRENGVIMVLQKEIDLENIEKSGCYNGKYFVLGGIISLLNPEQVKKIRMRELWNRVNADKEVNELVIALNADKEGEATVNYIKQIMDAFVKKRGLKITRFARGLSSGSEIEYIDKDTIKNAFLNRK